MGMLATWLAALRWGWLQGVAPTVPWVLMVLTVVVCMFLKLVLDGPAVICPDLAENYSGANAEVIGADKEDEAGVLSHQR
jgi:hypothetical protein